MTTTKTRKRTPRTKSANAPRRSVEEMLREIAYVLHVTRKINRETAWPAVASV